MGHEGPIALVVASILGIVAWAVFILFYALLWSSKYSLFQNIIVAVVTLVIAGLLIGLMWVVWGMKRGWRYSHAW
jgi:hypothetical protein